MNKRIDLLLLITFAVPLFLYPQVNRSVAIIYNTNYSQGISIAEYYAQKRNIPSANIIGLPLTTEEVITKDYYYNMIRDPLKAVIDSRGLKSTIKYLVTTKGMPLKIRTVPDYCDLYNQTGGGAIESFLCILYEVQADYCSTPRIVNQYYDKGEEFKSFEYDFTSYCPDNISGKVSYLVSRLDAFTPEEVYDMIDRSVNADTSGTGYYVIDDHPGAAGYEPWAMRNAAINLKNQGLGKYVLYDSTTYHILADSMGNRKLIGYTGRGRHANNNSTTPSNMGWSEQNGYLGGNRFSWLKGAVFTTYESFNGYSFFLRDDGCPGQAFGHRDEQNLVSDFIRDGGTAAIGNVYEPFISGVSHADIFLKYYAAGYNFIDAAYMSLSFLTGMNVVVGDPLCRISNKLGHPVTIVSPRLTLYYNYPNPFSYNTTIRYRISETSGVKLLVYNILGEKILEVAEETVDSGEHAIPISLKDFPQGVYFYQVQADGESASGKMLFLTINRPK